MFTNPSNHGLPFSRRTTSMDRFFLNNSVFGIKQFFVIFQLFLVQVPYRAID